MPEFETSKPISVEVRLGAGALDLVAEARDTAVVEVAAYDDSDASREAARQTRVELRGDTLVIQAPEAAGWLWRRGGRVRVGARVPIDSGLDLKLASASARCGGRYATATVHSASGDVSVDEVTGDAVVHSASGDLHVDRVGGHLRFNSASGDTIAGSVGESVGGHTASGDVRIGEIGGSVDLKTASGDVRIGTVRRGSTRVHTASGDVPVGVAPGTGVWLDLTSASGATRSDLTMGGAGPANGKAELNISVRTASGDIEVYRAGKAAA